MIRPHGGKLIDRVIKREAKKRALQKVREIPQVTISQELANDVANIGHGVFSPLEGFLGEKDYLNVLNEMRLSNDMPWPIPILLDVSLEEAEGLKEGQDLALVDESNHAVAIMHLEEKYQYSKRELAEKVFQTNDPAHPGVARVLTMGDILLAGKIDLISEPQTPFLKYTLRPAETRILFKEKGWKTVAGFQTRNIPHIGHEYIQKTALAFVDGIFINPIIGKKKKGDFTDEVILESYEALIKHYYLKERAVMSILSTEMRYAGPREAVFHAIIRKNFGCTHFLVGRDHAGVGNYYEPYAAHEIFEEFPDLEIIAVFFKRFFYCRRCQALSNEMTCPHSEDDHINFSGTRIREMLSHGKVPPKELMRPEVAQIIVRRQRLFVE